MNHKTCIIIVGPTAVGKTSLSIELAKQFNTSIISADSRQCFTELNIGVAKPSPAQLAEIPHFFINSHHLNDEVNAALFEKLSLKWVGEIFQKKDVAVIVGGTGLYIKAFSEGLDDVPPSSRQIREQITADYNLHGIEWLQQQIEKLDPFYFKEGEMLNPQRMLRALEVLLITTRSILSFRSGTPKKRPFNILKIGLDRPRSTLYQQINQRVEEMISSGLVEEARSLLPYRDLNALQTVGYKELFDSFDGKTSLEKSIDLIKQNTRHYAKRQLTWFRKDESIHWFDASEAAVSTAFIHNCLTSFVDPDQG